MYGHDGQGRPEPSMLEFFEWRKTPGNATLLRAIVRRHSQADGLEVVEIATLVADHLKTRCNVIPLGGPQYGQLFRIIKDVLNEDPDEGFDVDC